LRKLDPAVAPITTGLGVLGMPGFTAYTALNLIGKPNPGETVCGGRKWTGRLTGWATRQAGRCESGRHRRRGFDPLLHRGLAHAELDGHLRRRRFLPAPAPASRFRLRPQNWQLGCEFFALQLLERRGVADRLSLALGCSQLLAEQVLLDLEDGV
jgi:hypothetical protein